jgi:hypothetical protein
VFDAIKSEHYCATRIHTALAPNGKADAVNASSLNWGLHPHSTRLK